MFNPSSEFPYTPSCFVCGAPAVKVISSGSESFVKWYCSIHGYEYPSYYPLASSWESIACSFPKCEYCGKEIRDYHYCEGSQKAAREKKIKEAITLLSENHYSVFEPDSSPLEKCSTQELQLELRRRKDRPKPPTWKCERCGEEGWFAGPFSSVNYERQFIHWKLKHKDCPCLYMGGGV